MNNPHPQYEREAMFTRRSPLAVFNTHRCSLYPGLREIRRFRVRELGKKGFGNVPEIHHAAWSVEVSPSQELMRGVDFVRRIGLTYLCDEHGSRGIENRFHGGPS